ncbi:hypothetical protein LTR50_001744 [Elasticomyces elasticus]|nr:hypothetical protein LTR50_001744 [Elasticomyces elasticus]
MSNSTSVSSADNRSGDLDSQAMRQAGDILNEPYDFLDRNGTSHSIRSIIRLSNNKYMLSVKRYTAYDNALLPDLSEYDVEHRQMTELAKTYASRFERAQNVYNNKLAGKHSDHRTLAPPAESSRRPVGPHASVENEQVPAANGFDRSTLPVDWIQMVEEDMDRHGHENYKNAPAYKWLMTLPVAMIKEFQEARDRTRAARKELAESILGHQIVEDSESCSEPEGEEASEHPRTRKRKRSSKIRVPTAATQRMATVNVQSDGQPVREQVDDEAMDEQPRECDMSKVPLGGRDFTSVERKYALRFAELYPNSTTTERLDEFHRRFAGRYMYGGVTIGIVMRPRRTIGAFGNMVRKQLKAKETGMTRFERARAAKAAKEEEA